ncbi:MAG TPA: NAD(+) synthase [Acidobacteriota bacterium]|nr:NAD(+) synthase [Acidobacteriota bacterium]
MTDRKPFSPDLLELDGTAEVDRIAAGIRASLSTSLRRRGLVVGISGGIDSSVTAALCVRALGRDKVIGLEMPERHSAGDTRGLADLVAARLGIRAVPIDITPILEAVGYYDKYDAAVREAVPGYGPGWRSKIVVSETAEDKAYTFFSVVAVSPDGREVRQRLDLGAYLAIVASTNFKQRIRTMLEYYHADLHNYAVAGTPNRLEYDQGFFVKLGDGAADIKPIAHLYKTQVYALARVLDLPRAVIDRPPTTDTYSLPQGQDEFFFAVPYKVMDLCLYGKNHGYSPEEVAPAAGLAPGRVKAIYQDIDRKRATTRYLHLSPVLVAPVPEIEDVPGSGRQAG